MTAAEPSAAQATVSLVVDGQAVEVPDDGSSLLDVLRERLGLRTLKDGCSPQGQCGCCTVLVDGQPRVACVTPARRVRGRSITTLDGLAPEERAAWGEAFCATGGSQCGFCTPGIVLRLSGLRARGVAADDTAAVEQALLAHLCRCTGWRTILDAWSRYDDVLPSAAPSGRPGEVATAVAAPTATGKGEAGRPGEGGTTVAAPTASGGRSPGEGRDLEQAAERASIEGRTPQRVGPEVALGLGGFADDTAPAGALVAVPDGQGGWSVGETLAEARAASGKVQGRRTTVAVVPPLELPPGAWDLTLRTSWVEPAYLETDAAWCTPGGEPASPLANGGAFGGKLTSACAGVARELADRHGRPVRVLLSREDVVRLGPKRPPIAAGIRADGSGIVRVVRTPGIAEAIARVAPDLRVEEVDVPGPPTSTDIRAAGWAEAVILLAAAAGARATPSASAEPRTAPALADPTEAAEAQADPTTAVATDGQSRPPVAPGPADRAATEGHADGADGSAEPGGPGATGAVRAAGDAEATVTTPEGATARARVVLGDEPRVEVRVRCGRPLDEVVLRSYCVGAAHMALSWVTSEGLAVDEHGTVHDLTVRSFGILRAVDTPPIEVEIAPDDGPPVNGSDAVIAAVAAATWLAHGTPPTWPTNPR